MANAEVCIPYVERVLCEVLGVDHLEHDDDGDVPIELEGTTMFVRVRDGAMETARVIFIAPMLTGVEATSQLWEKLNEVNHGSSYVRFSVGHGDVTGLVDLVAESLRPIDVRTIGAAVDWYVANIARLLDIPDAEPWKSRSSEGDGRDDRDPQEAQDRPRRRAIGTGTTRSPRAEVTDPAAGLIAEDGASTSTPIPPPNRPVQPTRTSGYL